MKSVLTLFALITCLVLQAQYSNKIFVLCDTGRYRIFVDSENQRAFLNVVEFLKDEPGFKMSSRRYEIKDLEPGCNSITYNLGANQYLNYSYETKVGQLCEYRLRYNDLYCIRFKNRY